MIIKTLCENTSVNEDIKAVAIAPIKRPAIIHFILIYLIVV